MKRYRSKIGVGLVLFLVIVLGGTIILMISRKNWMGVAINLAVILFITYLFLTTSYVIDGKILKIESGFLIDRSIRIDFIKRISKSNNPISAPAASLDRLEIVFNEVDSILVSPKDKRGFITHLKTLNPEIEVDSALYKNERT